MDTSTPQHLNSLPNRDIQQLQAPTAAVVEPGVVLEEGRQVLLRREQRLALEWLMNEEGATIKDAAEYAGVTRATVSSWVNHDPDFRAIYFAWREHQDQMNDGEMVGLEAAAMVLLREAVQVRRDQRAAEFILKQAEARRLRHLRWQQYRQQATSPERTRQP